MTGLHFSLLGEFRCYTEAERLVEIPTSRGRGLVAYLIMHPEEAIPRQKLAGLLWPEKEEAQSRANLRKSLSRIRTALASLGPNSLVDRGSSVTLVSPHLTVDALKFRELVAAATPHSLQQAVTLYRGEFLEGCGDCGDEFEHWMLGQRRHLAEMAQEALRRLVDHYVSVGAVDQAIHASLHLIELDELNESAHRMLMRLYLNQDRVGAACRQYQICRSLLERELNVTPDSETESLRALLESRFPGADLIEQTVTAETDRLPEHATVAQTAARNRERSRQVLMTLPSIAVIPFQVRSSPEPLQHIADGMVEDLIISLGRFRNLQVLAPASVFAYRDAAANEHAVGAELGARYAVAGTIQAIDSAVKVTVRLTDTQTLEQLWGERFECSRNEILRIEDEILSRIAATLVDHVERVELEQVRELASVNWPAYELMLQGWQHLRRLDLASIESAKKFFSLAVEQNPRLGRAYLGLALAHLREWACNSWNMWFFAPQVAEDYAAKALALDDYDARAHCMMGLCQLYTGDYSLAGQRLSRALELNPSDADVLAHAACGLAMLGEHEAAIECGTKALRLSPHHPDWYVSFAGFALMTGRRYQEAIAVMSEAPEAVCDTPSYIAVCYAHLGLVDESKQYVETLQRHYQRQLARGDYPADTTCIDWVLSMAPYRLDGDRQHFFEGLKIAGF